MMVRSSRTLLQLKRELEQFAIESVRHLEYYEGLTARSDYIFSPGQ